MFAKNNRVGFTVILVNFLLCLAPEPEPGGRKAPDIDRQHCLQEPLRRTYVWCIQFSINLYKMREKKDLSMQ